uniref:Transmembrane protein n=1 Tax=Corethron hystrix TaxID=216773 RepID=A0A7S1FW27_9STRA|mmetsp:Transcript_36488/g.85288  ORF Transcript_36488/g.85288 Transcript_36488/m.85288 type:complete len:304 (+) Transcript_36488:233-1144(+)
MTSSIPLFATLRLRKYGVTLCPLLLGLLVADWASGTVSCFHLPPRALFRSVRSVDAFSFDQYNLHQRKIVTPSSSFLVPSLYMSSSSAKPARRRRVRKDGKVLKKVEDQALVVEKQEIEDVVTPVSTTVEEEIPAEEVIEDDEEELGEDEEWEYYDDDEEDKEEKQAFEIKMRDVRDVVGSASVTQLSSASSSSPTSSDKEGGSFESLLLDAKRMEKKKTSSDEEDAPISDFIFNAVSTIVTADFFLIIGFLIWFVLGAVLSATTGNDTVQLAFNGIFQPVVQPALGVLMIGALVGNLGKNED